MHGSHWFSTLVCLVTLSEAAVIEVTAGGAVSEPTYQFSDSSGSSLARFTGSGTKITASTDLETGNGNSVDDLATRLAAAEATIASLQIALAAKLDAAIAATTYQPILDNGVTTYGQGNPNGIYNQNRYLTEASVYMALNGCSNCNWARTDGGAIHCGSKCHTVGCPSGQQQCYATG